MSFYGLRLEYSLEGNLNYIAWKDKMEAVIEDNELKEFIGSDIPQLVIADAQLLDAWKKSVAKMRRILVDGVQDHIVSNLHGNGNPYSMWNSLTYMFQNRNNHMNLALKYKLKNIKMEK